MLPGVEIGARILTLLKNTSNFLINGKEISQMDFVLNSSYIVVLFLAAFIMFIEYYKWAKENRISCDLTNYKISYYYFNKKDVCSLNIFALLLLGFL